LVSTERFDLRAPAPAIARRSLRGFGACAILLVVCTTAAAAQPAALLVRVLAAESGRALPNVEVLDLASTRPRFTDGPGEAKVPWPSDGRLRLRVRQIGFQFVERSVQRNELTTRDTLTILVERVAFALPRVFTHARTACEIDPDTLSRLLSAEVLAQLRAGAERYAGFVRAYPFRVVVDRRTATLGSDGKTTRVQMWSEDGPGDEWSAPYRPGDVVDRSQPGFSVPIHFVTTLADPRFWDHHCFAARGVETRDDRRLFRLEFAPAPSTRGVDWAGEAYVDSATSLLQRVDFRLSGWARPTYRAASRDIRCFGPRRLIIYVPDSTITMWWLRTPRDTSDWGTPQVVQLLRVRELRYRRALPPRTDSVRAGRP
jgi:hypothetical protein